jgi:hypothetical protein
MTPDPDTRSPAGKTAYALTHHHPQLELAALTEASAGVIEPGSERPARRDAPAGQGSSLDRTAGSGQLGEDGWLCFSPRGASAPSLRRVGRPAVPSPPPPAASAAPHALARRAGQPSGPSARGDAGVRNASGRGKKAGEGALFRLVDPLLGRCGVLWRAFGAPLGVGTLLVC